MRLRRLRCIKQPSLRGFWVPGCLKPRYLYGLGVWDAPNHAIYVVWRFWDAPNHAIYGVLGLRDALHHANLVVLGLWDAPNHAIYEVWGGG